jgi:phosphoesterase RecJ-like protein
MPLDWTPFVDLIHRHERFLLTTHIRPDGDGLGSMLALADALEALGKTVQMTVASAVPPRYDFLDPRRRVQRLIPPGDTYRNAQVAIVLDTGTWNQLGDFGALLRSLDVAKVVIDHHVTQDNLGAQPFVDTSAEATGRLVWEAINALGGKFAAETAHDLFVALAMDTGWFRHPNTTARTLSLASQLVAAGASPTAVYEDLNERNTLGRQHLAGLVLGRLTLEAGGRIAHTAILLGDYAATGAVPQDSEDMVNFTRSIDGVEVGLFFMEQPSGGTKVSLRSRQRVDVARIAEMFGGGGHRLASGAIVNSPLADTRARILAAVADALGPPADPTPEPGR